MSDETYDGRKKLCILLCMQFRNSIINRYPRFLEKTFTYEFIFLNVENHTNESKYILRIMSLNSIFLNTFSMMI